MVVISLAKSVPGFHNESGGHRVQRVPPTERRGRVHTSTVTVSVLEGEPEPSNICSDDDFEVRFHRGTGKGGQRRNKVATCCVITHIPTGLTQKADGRSRESNEELAKGKLRAAIAQLETDASNSALNFERVKQLSGIRRTYRFRDDMVIDHLTGKTSTCKEFLKGRISQLW